ncbi:MAG TPA: hypothetical protein VFU12_00240 [Glycomyces sp.]|nr:hypothetical protein [Glycomyces sp.]
MIGPEIFDRLIALVVGVVTVGFGLGVLLVGGTVLGSLVRARRLSRGPSAVPDKEPR